MLRRACYVLVMIFALILETPDAQAFFSRVIREDGRTYIVDSRGQRWDVTQAESIGFKPEGFQHGLGRNAFTPLDDSYLSDDTDQVSRRLRVLGVVENAETQAYSIRRLGGHEIANSKIGSKAIAVGY
jgi:hypothetical protein